ncbi:unnamed protein product [Caenorhabditis brenneri]
MLKTSVLLACLAATAFGQNNYFEVLIREIDNPAGTLQNGKACNNFGFLGSGCNTYLKAAVSATGGDVSTVTGGGTEINTKMETKISNINLVVSDSKAASATNSFSGFALHVVLASDDAFTKIIDDYIVNVSTTQEQGVYTYTSIRPATLSTTISIAWSTNIAPPSTSTSPEPTTTGVPFTGSTAVPTTTPRPPIDCSEVVNATSGVQTIYPDGTTAVQVYCDITSYGAYTIIQSRGTSGQNISFDLPYANYSDAFGTPGKGNNYWFGLENMNKISNAGAFNLQIDLCCGTKLIQKQIYHNFKVGTAATNYTLTGSADVSGIGLDYSSTVKDLGAKFSTKDKWNGGAKKIDSCDQFDFYDDDNNKGPSQAYGGWWYGSCGNNLNGFLYPASSSGNCTLNLETFDTNLMLGINMRTTSGQGFDGYDVDLQSYDRVRMALFKFDSTTIDRSDDSFCN